MPRPRKVVSEEIVCPIVVEETPSVLEVVEEIAEEVVESSEVTQVEEPVTVKSEPVEVMGYKVFEKGELILPVEDGSDELNYFLDRNKFQINSWIEELKKPIDDEKLLFKINYPQVLQPYNSIAHYQAQNGFAPIPPQITNMLDYHKIKLNLASDEEVAVAVMGDLDYSFVPVKIIK